MGDEAVQEVGPLHAGAAAYRTVIGRWSSVVHNLNGGIIAGVWRAVNSPVGVHMMNSRVFTP
jgi:hypothetical protein